MDALDDKIGQLLVEVGDGLAGGYSTEDVEDGMDRSRSWTRTSTTPGRTLRRQAWESARMNPRRSAGELKDPQLWMVLLRHMEQALAETRSMARTLAYRLAAERARDAEFRQGYIAVLHEGGAGTSGRRSNGSGPPAPARRACRPDQRAGRRSPGCGRCTAA